MTASASWGQSSARGRARLARRRAAVPSRPAETEDRSGVHSRIAVLRARELKRARHGHRCQVGRAGRRRPRRQDADATVSRAFRRVSTRGECDTSVNPARCLQLVAALIVGATAQSRHLAEPHGHLSGCRYSLRKYSSGLASDFENHHALPCAASLPGTEPRFRDGPWRPSGHHILRRLSANVPGTALAAER
jgi:hypothetical protein